MAFAAVAQDPQLPRPAADFAILDERAGDFRFEVDLDLFAAIGTGHEELSHSIDPSTGLSNVGNGT